MTLTLTRFLALDGAHAVTPGGLVVVDCWSTGAGAVSAFPGVEALS